MGTFTYYDDYSWASNSYSTAANSKLINGIVADEHAEALPATTAAQQEINTRGMVTGTKVRVLLNGDYASGNFLSTINYYDAKGRVIQTKAKIWGVFFPFLREMGLKKTRSWRKDAEWL